MDSVFLEKAFALIAKGMIEKEQLLQKEPVRYPYSKELQHGINMFLAASIRMGKTGENVFEWADEASFLRQFITRPIAEWFSEWNPDAVKDLKLEDQPFYGYEAFAYRRNENLYIPSSECYEFLDTQDNDIISGTDERVLYEKMRLFSQDAYCRVRRYLIEHPIITIDERRMMRLELVDDQVAKEAFEFAYEEITEESFRCPCCGWTMTRGKYGVYCHSPHCTDITPELTDDMKLDISGGMFRLKKGIMRYFAQPGKLELAIVDFCEKRKLSWTLWPYMDTFDVEIRFSDGEVWEVDAKAYRNPITLRTKIKKDNGFPAGDYTRGYFVVPSEYTAGQCNYTSVVNKALKQQTNVSCITLRTLKSEISRKEAQILAEE